MAAVGLSLFPHGLSVNTAATLGQEAEAHGFDGIFVMEGGTPAIIHGHGPGGRHTYAAHHRGHGHCQSRYGAVLRHSNPR